MDIDDLFAEANVVSTAAVARFADISEATAREWADDLTVARIGASFAWTREDVEKLLECLESEAEDDSDDGGDDPDEDDDDDDGDGETEDEDDEEGDAA
jgi:hypothetical protein